MDSSSPTFGRYRPLARIGAGGMAEVWLAVQPGAAGFETRVVLKRLPVEKAGDPVAEAMFADEARLMTSVRHPNLVAALDFVDAGNTRLLVLEWVDGCDLAELLEAGPLSPGVVARLGAELAAGLAHLHGHPSTIVHRDVSPSNVLVSREGAVKLGDFGIARAARGPAWTAPGTVRGKLSFLAPERAQGLGATPASDLFALGLVLSLAATGRTPWRAHTDAELLTAVRSGAVEPPSASVVGEGLAAVLARLLEPEVGRRAWRAAEVREALLRVPDLAPPEALGALVQRARAAPAPAAARRAPSPWTAVARLDGSADGLVEPL